MKCLERLFLPFFRDKLFRRLSFLLVSPHVQCMERPMHSEPQPPRSRGFLFAKEHAAPLGKIVTGTIGRTCDHFSVSFIIVVHFNCISIRKLNVYLYIH